MSTDRIEKKILLQTSLKRAWQALSDSSAFGQWFGVRFDGPFVAGSPLHGVVTPTTVDPEVARHQRPLEGKPFDIVVDRIEPERLFSFRWHPFAIEPGVDYSSEPMTLIEFTLEETPGGVMLTVTESGFDRIPLARRAEAFTANESGWGMVVKLIAQFLGHAG